jgi:hypothetical protein
MNKNTKNLLIGAGVIVAVYYIYKHFVKKPVVAAPLPAAATTTPSANFSNAQGYSTMQSIIDVQPGTRK